MYNSPRSTAQLVAALSVMPYPHIYLYGLLLDRRYIPNVMYVLTQ